MSSSSEITIEEWVLAGMAEGTDATGVTEAAGMTEGTDAEGARGAGATEAERLASADSLKRSNSMKCV